MEGRIAKFFEAYAKRLNDALGESPSIDTDGAVHSFADYFVGSTPVGVRGAKNGWLFRLMVPRGYRHYRKIGTKSMTVSSLEVSELDSLHAMAKVHWDSLYEKEGKEIRIEFDVIYFLTFQSGEPKIFSFIAGDEQKVLKEHGLVP